METVAWIQTSKAGITNNVTETSEDVIGILYSKAGTLSNVEVVVRTLKGTSLVEGGKDKDSKDSNEVVIKDLKTDIVKAGRLLSAGDLKIQNLMRLIFKIAKTARIARSAKQVDSRACNGAGLEETKINSDDKEARIKVDDKDMMIIRTIKFQEFKAGHLSSNNNRVAAKEMMNQNLDTNLAISKQSPKQTKAKGQVLEAKTKAQVNKVVRNPYKQRILTKMRAKDCLDYHLDHCMEWEIVRMNNQVVKIRDLLKPTIEDLNLELVERILFKKQFQRRNHIRMKIKHMMRRQAPNQRSHQVRHHVESPPNTK